MSFGCRCMTPLANIHRGDRSADVVCVRGTRSAALRGLRTAVAECAGDADQCLHVLGICSGTADVDGLDISVAKMSADLARASVELGCPELGLRVAARQDLSALGPLAWVVRSCGTIAEACTWVDRILLAYAPTLCLLREPDPCQDRAVVGLRFHDDAVGQCSDVLATARSQRWDPTEVVKALLTEESAGRARSMLTSRHKAAGFPTGKTFDVWAAHGGSCARDDD